LNLSRSVTLGSSICCLALVGCAGYIVGNRTLYRSDITTVHVPVFTSESYRRFLGERLTEAVVKEIELKTPYKVVSSPFADSALLGRITRDAKYTIAENVNDESRDIEAQVYAEITWRDRNGQTIVGPEAFAVPGGLLEVAQAVHFIPEGGQSLATAQQDAIARLAEQIVSRMEAPW
jgi:Lipopolysaccharide-assembly